MGNMKQIEITLKIDIQKIDDQLITALEGGSNYWYYIKEKNVIKPANFSRNENIHYEFLDTIYQGATMEVCDIDSGKKLGELNMTTIKRGLESMQKDYPTQFNDLIQETGDAETADVFFQLCVIGDLVFA